MTYAVIALLVILIGAFVQNVKTIHYSVKSLIGSTIWSLLFAYFVFSEGFALWQTLFIVLDFLSIFFFIRYTLQEKKLLSTTLEWTQENKITLSAGDLAQELSFNENFVAYTLRVFQLKNLLPYAIEIKE